MTNSFKISRCGYNSWRNPKIFTFTVYFYMLVFFDIGLLNFVAYTSISRTIFWMFSQHPWSLQFVVIHFYFTGWKYDIGTMASWYNENRYSIWSRTQCNKLYLYWCLRQFDILFAFWASLWKFMTQSLNGICTGLSQRYILSSFETTSSYNPKRLCYKILQENSK
jgi:hypothetical protein